MSVKKPIVTPQAVQKAQGTRLQEKAPWESYNLQEELSPELEAAVAEYSTHRHDDSSNQTKEAYAEQKELSDEVAKEYQFVAPDEYNNVEERMGRILHSSEFINLLRDKLGLKCWYRTHPHADKLTLLVQNGLGTKEPEIACWVQNGWMPSLSVMRFDEHGVPLNEQFRGYRTCLLQMILKGLVTEEKVNAVFGKPGQTKAWARYNETLQSYRNRDQE